MRMSESIKELSSALSKFQGEVRNPHNEATNPQFRSKYAPLDVVVNTVKPILTKYGLSFIQSTSSEGEMVGITTLLMHESGEWIESDVLLLPAYQLKKGGEKEFNSQAIGSSQTYGRRYQLSAMLGVSSEDDDDANGQVFGSNNGYKDASSNPTANHPKTDSNADAEKRRQEAIARAQARKAQQEQANSNPTPNPTPPADAQPTGATVEPIQDNQLRAIHNLLNLNARKYHSFEKEDFILEQTSQFGVTALEELTSDQAKEVISNINKKAQELKQHHS